MKAYIVRRPGNDPCFFATQADAKGLVRESCHGSSFEKVDTGANAQAQIDFLNDLAHWTFGEGSRSGYAEAKKDLASGDLRPPRALDAVIEHKPLIRNPIGPGRDGASKGAELTAASMTLTAMQERIQQADGWMLSNILDSAICRLRDLPPPRAQERSRGLARQSPGEGGRTGMNAPQQQQWRTPPAARHLRVEDIDAPDLAEASRRRRRNWDRACLALGLVGLAYFAAQLLRPWL